MNVAIGGRIVGSIRSLVYARDLQLECVTVMHEALPVPVLIMTVRQYYGRRRKDLELWLYR